MCNRKSYHARFCVGCYYVNCLSHPSVLFITLMYRQSSSLRYRVLLDLSNSKNLCNKKIWKYISLILSPWQPRNQASYTSPIYSSWVGVLIKFYKMFSMILLLPPVNVFWMRISPWNEMVKLLSLSCFIRWTKNRNLLVFTFTLTIH